MGASGLGMLLVVTQSEFRGNSARQQGGAMDIVDVNETIIDQCVFERNNASRGGAVALEASVSGVWWKILSFQS